MAFKFNASAEIAEIGPHCRLLLALADVEQQDSNWRRVAQLAQEAHKAARSDEVLPLHFALLYMPPCSQSALSNMPDIHQAIMRATPGDHASEQMRRAQRMSHCPCWWLREMTQRRR